MLELFAPLLARHGPTSVPSDAFPACPLCGRRGVNNLTLHTLSRNTIPPYTPAFRSVDFSTRIFVTDTFRDAALANGLRDEWFVEVALE